MLLVDKIYIHALFPAVAFALEVDLFNFVCIAEPVDITFPERGRRHPVTNYFNRQKIIVVFAEKMF